MYGFLGWFGLGFVMCGGHNRTSVDRRRRISDAPFVEGTTESDSKGSVARTVTGTFDEDSDLDLAVILPDPEPGEKFNRVDRAWSYVDRSGT